MLITKALRKHMAEKFNVPATATDEEVQKSVSDAMFKGELTLDTLKELTKAEATDAENRVRGMVTEEVQKAVAPLNDKFDQVLSLLGNGQKAAGTTPPPGDGTDDSQKALGQLQNDLAVGGTKNAASGDLAKKAYAQGAGAGGDGASTSASSAIRVKAAVEQYSSTTATATYEHSSKSFMRKHMGPKRLWTGEGPGGRFLDMPSERTKAIAGAWLKHMINRAFRASGRPVPLIYRMTEHDQQLVEYAVHECKFVGPHQYDDVNEEAKHWFSGQKLDNDLYRKALLDDATSGGLEAVPIEFDDAAIITPLLNGELFPFVNVRNVTRRRIEGFSIGNPTLQWGTGEGTAISLFDTAGFIAGFDNSIYPVTGAIEIGLDFEADSPVGIGDMILGRYGEAFRKELDGVVAVGNGTSQPQGLFNAAGTATVTAANGNTGPAKVSDYEGLLFGVKKEYRQEAIPGNRAVFIGTETSYQRSRAIPVSETDQRRVFGMDEESYMLLSHRYAICEALPNTKVGFFCLNRYRMYRRQGYEVRVVTEDRELALKNQRLLIVRARFGGSLELGGAGAVTTNAQT